MFPAREEDFYELIDACFPLQGGNMLLGRGDDCAVFDCSGNFCISSDLFLEDIHFRRAYFKAADIGYKSLAVNISDIAAMGAKPVGFMLNLMVPSGLDMNYWRELLQSMAKLASEYDLMLAGGDVSRAASLGLDITIWGVAEERYLQRKKSQKGDYLFVVGALGLARAGMGMLEKDLTDKENMRAIQAHLRPDLYVAQALKLGKAKEVRGLMDISDGLMQDLPRFLGPGHGADLTLTEEDLYPEVIKFAREMGKQPLQFALQGGEDYALLGALDENGMSRLQTILPEALIIGRVTDYPGIYLQGQTLSLEGFDHFA